MTPRPQSQPNMLSPRGLARRDAMLDDLQGAVRARGRRRRATRTTSALAAVALIATGVAAVSRLAGTPPPTGTPPVARSTEPAPLPTNPAPPQTRPAPARTRIAYVTNDTDILARVTARPDASRVRRLDDDALLDSLRTAGLPAGIARSRGEVRLAFHTAPPRPETN